jgi:hypothetical protein
MSKEGCQNFIDMYEQEVSKGESPHLRKSEFEWLLDYRSFNELNITCVDSFKPYIEEYYARLKTVYDHYKSVVGDHFFPSKFAFEDVRLKKYEANDYDQFGWHVDVGDKPSASRFLVMFMYLNDVEEGGTTEFQDDNGLCTVNPVSGRILVFPPMWMYPHRGAKPVSGPKYILSTYLHYI